MALVKMPVKKAVKAISAANAFAAAGKNAAGETDEASYHEWLASLAPKKTQRDREHERERAWRNRPRNETSEDPRTGTGGYALPGSSGNLHRSEGDWHRAMSDSLRAAVSGDVRFQDGRAQRSCPTVSASKKALRKAFKFS